MSLSNILYRKSTLGLNIAIYAVLAYFAYHILHGERSLFSYLSLTKELNQRQAVLDKLLEDKGYMEQRVSSVRSQSLDLDMLDELARKNLGLIGEGESLIITENSQSGLNLE